MVPGILTTWVLAETVPFSPSSNTTRDFLNPSLSLLAMLFALVACFLPRAFRAEILVLIARVMMASCDFFIVEEEEPFVNSHLKKSIGQQKAPSPVKVTGLSVLGRIMLICQAVRSRNSQPYQRSG